MCRCIFAGVENFGKRVKVLHECQANASIVEAGQTLSEYTTKEHSAQDAALCRLTVLCIRKSRPTAGKTLTTTVASFH